MKLGRQAKGVPSADLLVCFPSRSHLALMPKPICSPARPPESGKLHRHRRRKKSISGAGGVHASPLAWAKAKTMGCEMSEPSSPKVTCAGQIKIRPKNSSCKSWESVMEEIERIHKRKLQTRRSNWVELFGFKKDIMQFLSCLRSIRFDFRCFRAFPESDFSTDDEDEEEEEEERSQENKVEVEGSETVNVSSRTALSRWVMVLQETQRNGVFCRENGEENNSPSDDMLQMVAPPNALMLMRCRSAPAKSWLEEKAEAESEEEEDNEKKVKVRRSLKWLMEEEKKGRLAVEMEYDSCRISSEETFSRSRSWRN